MTRDEALALLRGGEEGLEQWRLRRNDQSRTPVDLSGVDLRGAELTNIVFYAVNLEGADLSGADLSGSSFEELVRVNLDGATLNGTFLSSLTDCTARGADLNVARFSGAITRTDLTEAKLQGVYSLRQSERAVFRNADLTGAELRGSTHLHSVFDGADLSRATLDCSDCRGGSFRGATLADASLTRTNLSNADLTGANLTRANLAGADLSGAIIEGANFTDANLYAAKLDALGPGQPIGFVAPEPAALERIGPGMRHLEAVWRKTGSFDMTLHIDPTGEEDSDVRLRISGGHREKITGHSNWMGHCLCQADTLCEAMLELAHRWPEAVLYLATLRVRTGGDKESKRGLREKALVAWHEAFGRSVPSQSERRANQLAHRQRFLELLRGGPEGIERWNALGSEALSQAGHFREANLSGCDLQGASLSPHFGSISEGLDFSGCNFDRVNQTGGNLGRCILVGATLRNATLDRVVCIYTNFRQADLTGASLKGCSLRSADCSEADFSGADLTRADLSGADLRGANLSSAILDEARFKDTVHDETTSFPEGFTFPEIQSGLPPGLEVGSRVRIETGAFLGSEGVVKTLDELTNRVTVVVVLWGRPIDVELETDEVVLI